ncbi:VOC family protein [Kitasatospora sp. NPDC004614]|uniref:VOC family protein n=1 Tax=unclassified Kitasatospora TaxID=2633591 RepID=UPI0036AFFCFA
MTLAWKLVVDSADASAIAEFWAAALEYEVEDPTALIDSLLAAGRLPAAAVLELPDGRKQFRGFSAVRHPDDPHDPVSGIGKGRRILFQDVPEAKSTKNRLHLDIHSDGQLEPTVERLESLGAKRVKEHDQGPVGHWWIMLDPEGNEFCVA